MKSERVKMLPSKDNPIINHKISVIAGSPHRMDWTRNPVVNEYSSGDCGSEAAMTGRGVSGIKKTNKFWLIILGSVVLVASIAAVLLWSAPTIYARIYKDGKLTETVNLAAVAEPFGLLVESNNSDNTNMNYNYLEVEHGRIRVSKASCPDGICIRQGWSSSGLIPIVCLPNRLVVTFDSGGSEFDVDAVAG